MLEPTADRPHMPDYGIRADAAGLLPWSWARERLTLARFYWVCTTRPDGRPHVVPVEGLWIEGVLYFGAKPGTRRARNLQANADVAVHLESAHEAVILEGRPEQVADAALLKQLAGAYAKKYGFHPRPQDQQGTYAMRAHRAFSWKEDDFLGSATRWRFQ